MNIKKFIIINDNYIDILTTKHTLNLHKDSIKLKCNKENLLDINSSLEELDVEHNFILDFDTPIGQSQIGIMFDIDINDKKYSELILLLKNLKEIR